MKNINDVTPILQKYLLSIDVDPKIVNIALDLTSIKSILVMKLPAVCLLKENRVDSKSKQTHIHVTGANMNHFYPQNYLNATTASTEDEPVKLNIFPKNIDHLLNKSNVLQTKQEIVKSSTVKKIAVRGDKSIQVQISKLKVDDKAFLMLRKGLFEHDYLVFISYKNSEENTVIGLKSTIKLLSDDEKANLFINSLANILKHKPSHEVADTVIEDEIEYNYLVDEQIRLERTTLLKTVTPDTIASFIPSDEVNDEEDSNLVDLSNGIKIRKKRTERHHDIVKQLAKKLDAAGYLLSEYPIDCLASKDNTPLLIFEVKTLNGLHTDERNQVLNCFAQLFYYERFDLDGYPHLQRQKIAVFESKISEEHIDFLQSNGILVMWLEGSEFAFTYESSSFFNEVSFL